MGTVGVVGAGPAGIAAALAAAEVGARVVLFDTNRSVGRKLSVTGNGRGNLTNLAATAEHYHCASRATIEALLGAFGPAALRRYLVELGVLTYSTEDGWCYPVSESAATVAELLAAALDLAGVDVRLLTKVDGLERSGRGWEIRHSGGSARVPVDQVVVATGGMAAPSFGSTGSLYPVLAQLGVRVLPSRPALAPLVGDMRRWHRLQGVRLDAAVRLLQRGRELGREHGNLMFTQSGLSGPAAMNLSHLVADPAQPELEAAIDLAPTHGDALSSLVRRFGGTRMPLAVLLGAVVPPKVPPVILSLAGLPASVRLDQVPFDVAAEAIERLRDLRVAITGTRGFAQAQLSTGGVPLTEVEAATMECRECVGLYLAGEVLDVVGPCGGYNLQFAFSSGRVAGRAAGRA
mgnify:FL=1